ncbi:PaaI family thioesterase [Mycobacterium sp. SMC-2]|nr:PaaI family thioesterase [Mycobacterium sp. SMC-2]UXA06459.1 PaaI family thioesterase [Mycobacterium sp. SMC-2]
MSDGLRPRGPIRQISSPCFTLTGMTFTDAPERGACARAALAPAWVTDGRVHPALLQVVLDSGLGMLAMTALAAQEVSISGAMQTCFAAGVLSSGTELLSYGHVLSHQGGLLVAYGDVVDDRGAVLAHGIARYHILVREPSDFAALVDTSVHGTAIEEVLSLVVEEESADRVVTSWAGDPRVANRHGHVHGGFVSALSELASRQVASRGRTVAPLEHAHRYLRPVPAQAGCVVRCEASIDRVGRQIVSTTCRLLDESAALLGSSTSTYAVTT